jgi:hypothetical protein
MNGFLKTIIAGWGAKKLGGGCFSTIIIFVLIYWALGQCNKPAPRAVSQQQAPVSTQRSE